jgi:hypothetical protein
MNRCLVGALIVSVGACGDATGPEPHGRRLNAGSMALDWSVDGTEIYHYASGYSSTSLPDRILAVNRSTGQTRIVVDSCASAIGGVTRIGFVPPRATIAGVAYIDKCGLAANSLRLVSGSTDSGLSRSGDWFTSCPARDCLIHNLPPSGTGEDSIQVIDLVQGNRRVFRTGSYGPSVASAVSPDGNALLVERPFSTARFAILSLVDGTIQPLPDSILPYSAPIPLGWNDAGLWFLAEPRITLVVYDPVSGGAQRFPTGETVGQTRVLTGGSVTTTGAAVWMQQCNAHDSQTGLCTQAAYFLWLWNPLAAVDRMLVRFYDMPAYDFPEVLFAGVSPDGQRLAYVLGDELRLIDL